MCTNMAREPRGRGSAILAVLLALAPTWIEAAQLRVETRDGPRQVWVNGRYAGVAPVVLDTLTAGAATVAIGEPAISDSWVLAWTTRVELTESVARTVEAPPLQRLRVLTPPVSSELFVDGMRVGSTPLQLLLPADRTSRLEVRAPGLEPQTWEYRPEGRTDSTLRVSMSIVGRGRAREAENSGWLAQSSTLLPIGAVLAGVAGVWSRQTADRAYDEYLGTVDGDRMRRNLDRANRYDDVAVGLWIAAEVLLAASAWSWLRAGVAGDGGDPLRTGPRVGIALEEIWTGDSP